MSVKPAADNYVSGFGSVNLSPSDVFFDNRRWLDQQAATVAAAAAAAKAAKVKT